MPIARGIFKDRLTFFSREGISPGTVVYANVRGRKIPGIVLSSGDVRDEKSEIRSADFALKKIDTETLTTKKIFRASFIRAVMDAALWHGIHEGTAAAQLTSSVILGALPKIEPYIPAQNEQESGVKADLLVLQAEYEERVRTYRNLAREAFARNASVFIITPTVAEAERLTSELERGIEERVVMIIGDLSKKKLIDGWNKVVSANEPLLVVGTALALSVPRADMDTIIIERESARSYRLVQKPHTDARRAAESLSRHSGARLILADLPIRVETRYRLDVHEAEELARSQLRPSGTNEIIVVDNRKTDSLKGEKRVFSALSADTKKRIKEEIGKGGRAAIFAARRGIAPLTVCNDCGTPITDAATGTPMTLHKTANGNVFLSHRSGAVLPAETACGVCGGWNLVTLGIGVDRVEEELRREFPDAEIFVFTKDSVPTHREAKRHSAAFYKAKGAIAVGTERLLPYLTNPVGIVAIASIDAALSLSAWRAHETVLSILYYLNERAEHAFIIETRKPDNEAIKAIRSGNPLDFYRTDITEREKYGYPPFSVFVGLTASGPAQAIEKLRALIKETFAGYDLVGPLPAEAATKALWSTKAVVRVPPDTWPNADILEKVKSLPPSVSVTIDPDDIV